jgi:hypothetical protein
VIKKSGNIFLNNFEIWLQKIPKIAFLKINFLPIHKISTIKKQTALDLLSTCSLSLKQLLNDYELNSIARCARSKTIWGKWWLKELRDGKLFKLHCLKWSEPRFNVNYNKNIASLICGMEDSDTWENKTLRHYV